MGLIQDFKDLKWPGKLAVTAAMLAGLAAAGFGAHTLKGKKLEETVSAESAYKPGKTEDGKPTYTFLTNENQREGYTAKFSDEKAFKRFNDFAAQYTIDQIGRASCRERV